MRSLAHLSRGAYLNKLNSLLGKPKSKPVFTVKISNTDISYLTLVEQITIIYGNPVNEGWYLANTFESMNCYILILKGIPDKRYSLLSLQYNCEITSEHQ